MFAKTRELLAIVALSSVCASLSGCFLFYDSRWGQAKASQKRVAAHAMPSELRADAQSGAVKDPNERSKPVEHLRIRAYATPHYAAAFVDGQAQFEQALRDANPTLAHDLSFRLELSDYQVWPRNAPPSSKPSKKKMPPKTWIGWWCSPARGTSWPCRRTNWASARCSVDTWRSAP